MCSHILTHLQVHQAHQAPSNPPLFVGVQGPQGSGKTYLTSQLRDTLASSPHNLSVVVLSIDDLYLPHSGLVKLAQTHPENKLLRGRGQPGTHDVPLGTEVLRGLKGINESQRDPSADNANETDRDDARPSLREVLLPSFDKSMYNGEGDRHPDGIPIRAPVDVVVMEGWCMGFYPVSHKEIDLRWERPVKGLESTFEMSLYRKGDIVEINEMLKEYVGWWDFFDAFIQVSVQLAGFVSHFSLGRWSNL